MTPQMGRHVTRYIFSTLTIRLGRRKIAPQVETRKNNGNKKRRDQRDPMRTRVSYTASAVWMLLALA